MSRRIPVDPKERQFFVVDANFLVNKFIPYSRVAKVYEQRRVMRSQDWWAFIDRQLNNRKATVYIPDICIAEAFKVLAKKYYEDKYFRNSQEYKLARDQMRDFISIRPQQFRAYARNIAVHDISTSRDIIIAVDRFYEVFFKWKLTASIVDLIILATAKYLKDFFFIPVHNMHIVTLDVSLWNGTRHLQDLPNAYNPNNEKELADKVFA